MITYQKSLIYANFIFSNQIIQSMESGSKSIDELKQNNKGKVSYLYPADR